MYVLMGVIFICIGLLMLISPGTVYQITEAWKSNASEDPSTLYVWHTRFGGCMFLVVGIAGIICQFVL